MRNLGYCQVGQRGLAPPRQPSPTKSRGVPLGKDRPDSARTTPNKNRKCFTHLCHCFCYPCYFLRGTYVARTPRPHPEALPSRCRIHLAQRTTRAPNSYTSCQHPQSPPQPFGGKSSQTDTPCCHTPACPCLPASPMEAPSHTQLHPHR